jgi:multicomponent K+:H+ antiporter subunit D
LLAASYGLLLHGHGAGQRQRLRASLHYVAFNLVGSALFLVAASLLYGVLGSLNLADLAQKWTLLPQARQPLAQAAALLLLTVFAVKAALLPLYFWLPTTYAAATAPVAALFALMTKVGVYAVLRVSTLVFGSALAAPWLHALALATLVLAAAGALAAARLRTLLGYGVVGSSGTLLLAAGLGTPASVAAGLFYLVSSTLTAAAGFLLADLLERVRGTDRLVPAPLGTAWATLGLAFVLVAVSLAGMPPLGGFLGKAWLLQTAVHASEHASVSAPPLPWTLAAVLGASLMLMLALVRAGTTLFWLPAAGAARAPGIAAPERWATGLLLCAVLACAAAAAPISRYTSATARQLFERQPYIEAVLGQRPVPAAYDLRREMRERGEAK